MGLVTPHKTSHQFFWATFCVALQIAVSRWRQLTVLGNTLEARQLFAVPM